MSTPRLEDDIEIITSLNSLRERAERARNEGLRGLLRAYRLTRAPSTCDDDPFDKTMLAHWAKSHEEPQDFIQPALLCLITTGDFQGLADGIDDLEPFQTATKQRLKDLTLDDLFDPDELKADRTRSRVPVFTAARVFQTLSKMPTTIFSRASMVAYYRVVRELYSVAAPSWQVGAARASVGGKPNAFMTGECTRAINGFARTLEQSAKFLNRVSAVIRQVYEVVDDDRCPRAWRISELRRITIRAFGVLSDAGRLSFFDVSAELGQLWEECQANRCPANHPPRIEDVKRSFNKFTASLSDALLRTATSAESEIRQAIGEIETKHKKEEHKHDLSSFQRTHDTGARQHSVTHLSEEIRHHLARTVALGAIQSAKLQADEGMEAASYFARLLREELPGVSNGQHTQTKMDRLLKPLEQFAANLSDAANRVRNLFSPCRDFLESVLDRELERGAAGNLNIAELAFAASSFSAMERPVGDTRIERAIELIGSAIGADGRVNAVAHLDTDFHGYSLMLVGSEVIRAIAYLIEHADVDLPPELPTRLLRYFETTAVRFPDGGAFIGWTHDHPRHPRRAYSWTTALAIIALHRIKRMLDSRINRRVRRHFTTCDHLTLRRDGPSLSGLLYSDYGLTLHPPVMSRADAEIRGKSVSELLELMRLHLLGVKPPPSAAPCYSMILHGPPGTGKTTLVEALAASAKKRLVQVTPSDFLVEGEAFVERRARAVFDALSCLTDHVIVFDEFEPLLRSRTRSKKDGNPNVFTFLMPGLLPKLKRLNGSAKRGRMTYVLITNRIESLDEAAIRSERFDYKIPIFPPDPISRAGYLERARRETANALADAASDDEVEQDEQVIAERLIRVIHNSKGSAMTAMSSPGFFLPGAGLAPGTALAYVLAGGAPIDPLRTDAHPPAKVAKSRPQHKLFEDEVWHVLRELEARLPADGSDWVAFCRTLDELTVGE